MNKSYPRNTAKCETNEEWAGSNILHDAFARNAEGYSYLYKSNGPKGSKDLMQVYAPNVPVSWTLNTPMTFRRQHFSHDVAMEGAKLVHAFLIANDVDAVIGNVDYDTMTGKKAWPVADRVVVGTNGTSDPIASEPSTIFMLPHMRRPLWNLVRFSDEKYEF